LVQSKRHEINHEQVANGNVTRFMQVCAGLLFQKEYVAIDSAIINCGFSLGIANFKTSASFQTCRTLCMVAQ
ncbi:MAG: hypothetical protein PVI77_19695, partial [Desulfobacterales bacterium]